MPHHLWDLENVIGGNYNFICGVDEVGRGALCSCIVGAAVILKPGAKEIGVKDSKKLSQKKREEIAKILPDYCEFYSIVEMSSEEIDNKGIQYCNKYVLDQAARRACENLQNYICIFDGRPLWKNNDYKYHFEEKADSLCLSVSAASILAKVYRDNILIELDKEYPEYGFSENKGYGTKEHMDAIDQFGIIPGVHRISFLEKFAYKI